MWEESPQIQWLIIILSINIAIYIYYNVYMYIIYIYVLNIYILYILYIYIYYIYNIYIYTYIHIYIHIGGIPHSQTDEISAVDFFRIPIFSPN